MAQQPLATTLFSVSQWLQGWSAPVSKKKSVLPKQQQDALEPDAFELMSCSELSSGAISDEGTSQPSDGTGTGFCMDDVAESFGYGLRCARPKVHARAVDYIARVQDELRLLRTAFPPETPSAVIGHALGYILKVEWNWRVKFCCQTETARLPETMPRAWVEDVLVVVPADSIYLVVDLRFRDKFLARCPGGPGEHFMSELLGSLPVTYVGLLSDLWRDMDTWATAMERAFRMNNRTLPPWRTKRSYHQLYKYCVEHDATTSELCLQRLGEQMSECGEGYLSCLGCCRFCSEAESVPVDLISSLRDACGASQRARRGNPYLPSSTLPLVALEYDFDKEDAPCEPALESSCGGLSFLLRGQ